DFSRVIQLGRIGDSGETYAFNRNGKLLSESRFDDDLRNIGLIASDAKGILEIEIRDPGGNMVTGYRPEIPRHQQPFTYMAERAIRGEAGENMTGYRDYRGVLVYGVWLWDSLLGLGITTEIDVEEALLPYRVVSWTTIGVLVVVLFFSSAGVIFTLFFGERANRVLQKARMGLEEEVQQRTADLRENEKKLNEALKASNAATHAKTAFLANMSHEIRTPMNAIIGFSEILIQTNLDDMQSKHVNTINRSAKSLLSLLNDILDIAKLEEGRLEIESITFNLPQVIDDVVSTLSIKAQEKKIIINLHYDPALPNCFTGDPARLRQVLINLMGNAIKFTDKGSVTLQVEPTKEKDFLHFKIKDTGIGIPENRLEAIFAPFAQADTSTTRKYGGTGLGTTISRQIVECMQGKIWAENNEGPGSTFHFTAYIPQADSVSLSQAGAEKIQVAFNAARALKILLAEDIPENVELASIRLEAVGHQLDVAVNGLETVEKFSKESYDLILMDVQMPVMDGLEATREIRKIEVERGGHIPIISLSASALAKDKVHCIEAGMDGFVSKPIDFNELFSEIAKIVPKDSGTVIDELEISPRKNNTSFPELAGINTQQGLKNWHDAKRYGQSLISFSHTHQQDGLLIKQALENKDLETAEKISHALKGVAGNLSITHVANIATEINVALKNKRDGYEPLVDDLNKSINEVVAVISQLNNDDDTRDDNPNNNFDVNKVTKLFNDMMVALGTDDPDNIEPILEQLKGTLNR
ncbi:MAG: ATP-binding protein, partial [Nitrosomonas sp.]|nr:ATP-binding protein [Nitrosomonas sp.]